MRGLIERRLLINWRADPELVGNLLPRPFEPQVVAGQAIIGLCLIRLRHVRPLGLPSWLGSSSENAAHRVAVEWSEGGRRNMGVYIFRRDTNARLNALAGGRIFPGVHQRSVFSVQETADRLRITVTSTFQQPILQVDAQRAGDWPRDSVFSSLEEASQFFERASIGYSPGRTAGELQALELRCHNWRAEPLAIHCASSSYFDDQRRFPQGTLTLDSGLFMERIAHEWHSRSGLSLA